MRSIAQPTRPLPGASREGVEISNLCAVTSVPGAAPLILTVLLVALAAITLRACDVRELEQDEHAAPACVGRCA